MPVPKRKTSKSRRDQRSANKFLRPKAFTLCPHCALPLAPHTLCLACGHYRGRKICSTKLDRALKRGEKRRAAQKTMDEQKNHVIGESAGDQP